MATVRPLRDIRRFPRRPCRGTVMIRCLQGDSEPIPGHLIDMSGDGLCAAVPSDLAMGTFLCLVFPANPRRSASTMVGSVVYCDNKDGRRVVGVRFGWETTHRPTVGVPKPVGFWRRLQRWIFGPGR